MSVYRCRTSLILVQLGLSAGSVEAERAINDRYTINNYPDEYPGLRVYKDSVTGDAWELTSIRVTVWGNQIVRESFYPTYLLSS